MILPVWINTKPQLTSCTSWEFIIFWKPIIFQNFWAMPFKNHSLTSYQNIYSNISFPKAVNKTCSCGVTIFTSHHKVITSSRSLQTRLLHQGVSRLLRHDDVDQSQTVSKSADFAKKMHFCSSESRESRIFGISALKTIVLRNKTKLFFDLQLVNCKIFSSNILVKVIGRIWGNSIRSPRSPLPPTTSVQSSCLYIEHNVVILSCKKLLH